MSLNISYFSYFLCTNCTPSPPQKRSPTRPLKLRSCQAPFLKIWKFGWRLNSPPPPPLTPIIRKQESGVHTMAHHQHGLSLKLDWTKSIKNLFPGAHCKEILRLLSKTSIMMNSPRLQFLWILISNTWVKERTIKNF